MLRMLAQRDVRLRQGALPRGANCQNIFVAQLQRFFSSVDANETFRAIRASKQQPSDGAQLTPDSLVARRSDIANVVKSGEEIAIELKRK